MTKFNLKKFVKFKPMKLTLKQLSDANGTLYEISNMKLPTALAYKISKVILKVRPEMEIYEEIRNKKVKELGEPVKDADGKDTSQMIVKKDGENWTKFIEDMKTVESQEIELDIPEIRCDEFPKDVMLTPGQFATMEWLIKE